MAEREQNAGAVEMLFRQKESWTTPVLIAAAVADNTESGAISATAESGAYYFLAPS